MNSGAMTRFRWLLLVAAISVALCAPFFRIFHDLADEGIFFRSAELILQGKRLYGDFFEFLPPGSFVLMAGWFDLAGMSIESARLLALLTIVGISCFTFLIARQISGSSALSALLVCGWLMMTQWHFMQISHHWFTTFFSVLAAWAASSSQEQGERRSLGWSLLAGLSGAAAAMITPTCGAWITLAAASAFFFTGQTWKELAAFALGIAFILAATLLLLIQQHTLAQAFDDVIMFPLTRYASIQYVPFDYNAIIFDLPLKYVFPLTALLFAFAVTRNFRGSLHDRRLGLGAALALAGFLACYPRPDSAHISYPMPLALPLLALGLIRLTAQLRPVSRYAIAAILLLFSLPGIIGYGFFLREVIKAPITQTPRGRAAFVYFTNGMPELLPVLAAAPKGAFFFYPHMPVLSFMAAREHVSKYDIFIPWYTTPAQYQEACLSAVRKATWVVIDRRYTDYDYFRQTYPSMPGSKPPETVRFEKALDQAFERVLVKGILDLRRRRQNIGDGICSGIDKA